MTPILANILHDVHCGSTIATDPPGPRYKGIEFHTMSTGDGCARAP